MGVGFVSVKFDDVVFDLHVYFPGLAQQGLHDGAVPGVFSSLFVIERFNLFVDFLFADFQHLGYFGEGYLRVVLEDGIERNILDLFESL
jgi:hypothetical protein